MCDPNETKVNLGVVLIMKTSLKLCKVKDMQLLVGFRNYWQFIKNAAQIPKHEWHNWYKLKKRNDYVVAHSLTHTSNGKHEEAWIHRSIVDKTEKESLSF
jgi:hypothetical protein